MQVVTWGRLAPAQVNGEHMVEPNKQIKDKLSQKYWQGFHTEIDTDSLPPGLSEEVITAISKENEPTFMLDFRLKAYRHWLTMPVPNWATLILIPLISRPSLTTVRPSRTKTGQRVSMRLTQSYFDTYGRLGIPLHEQKMLSGVAMDAVFDSVSVATTFKDKLAEAGVDFLPLSRGC